MCVCGGGGTGGRIKVVGGERMGGGNAAPHLALLGWAAAPILLSPYSGGPTYD